MAKDRKRLLRELRDQKYSCTLKQAEGALKAWGFQPGRGNSNVRVWSYKQITLTVHAPHGKAGKNMDPGAVALVIRKIEEAEVLQENRREEHQDGN